MSSQIPDAILRSMNEKSTEELKQIWIENNTNAWSQQAMEATEIILGERAEQLPPQKTRTEVDPFHPVRKSVSLVGVWRGEADLATTYWGFGVLAGFGFAAVQYAMYVGTIENVIPETAGVIVSLFVFVVNALYVPFFATIAVWRSAKNYRGQKLWAVLARVAVVFACIVTLLRALKIVWG